MNEQSVTVMKRAVFLWIGSGLVLGLNIFAAYQRSETMIYSALAITGLFALFGIAFGIWAARTVARPGTKSRV